jgi:hypothetical protein
MLLTDARKLQFGTQAVSSAYLGTSLVWTPSATSQLDPDTAAYLTATGLDAAYAPTLDALVVGLKSKGLWTKMKAVYAFIGGTAALHRWNLLDPRDVDAAYRLTFTGGAHTLALGYRANAQGAMSNGNYADTHLVPVSVLADVNSTHLAFYSLAEVPDADRCEMGCYNWSGNGSRFHILANYVGDVFYYGMSEEGASGTPMATSTGLFVATRTAAALTTAYRNGAQVGSSANAPANGLPNLSVWVGGINYFGSRTDLPCGFASIGSGLTAQNVADLYTLVQAFQTALGRQL